jgi:hypothetical protein
MATTKMNSDILSLINSIYDKKEAASEVSGLLENLKVNHGWDNTVVRKLATVEYDGKDNRKIINACEVPEELRKRLIQCADDYYAEMLRMFEEISVTSECINLEVFGDEV